MPTLRDNARGPKLVEHAEEHRLGIDRVIEAMLTLDMISKPAPKTKSP